MLDFHESTPISFFVVVLFLPIVKIASAENNPFDARAIFSA
ncbi:hypothetical protein L282_0032 [Escherichia coli APEC IMT5155]|uniref:Uncharacterized protein n=1 Tax=Shigella flexneri CCH060 TaxID=754091 RepID=A0A6N3QZH0_SHIFL|nr:hypothetical protein L282_0032 [Escherichia coli APEC IMT5155]EIQ10871.1 hypothetical protein SFCCH060_2243 [Shigella flexneri CCH060]EMV96058.1 hypothetical protein EC2860050_1259 [Escherichia coli 2860050]EMX03172.1 hypothetical protein ECP03047771_1432 [Escherichia coli P0304777.1]EMZ86604.1 hypothetical protein ECP03052931_1450 [Escherichia coli p0305293.1]ENE26364.1 hypothetical protein ECP030229310_1263 [Escherichia coli P0302293.10]ENG58178.1 hypothetical protein ECP03052932_1227 [E